MLAHRFKQAGLGTLEAAVRIRGVKPNARSQSDLRAIERTGLLVEDLLSLSYPELRGTAIRVMQFQSTSDYFRARFSFARFFFGPMQYLVLVNPRVFDLRVPTTGVRAILAHELGHVLFYKKLNRLQLLGLVRLISKAFMQEFERWADLQAISRGYGEGLREYRRWLYENIPASSIVKKQRNYFSPEEIEAILVALRDRPSLMEYWLRCVPRDLREIRNLRDTEC